jgi:prevent-host-death family protein
MWLYWLMASTGIRELRDNLSRYVRRIEAGERITVTAHGRAVAELGPPAAGAGRRRPYDDLVAAGIVRPPLEPGDPLADWPRLRLPAGTARGLIDKDRGEA